MLADGWRLMADTRSVSATSAMSAGDLMTTVAPRAGGSGGASAASSWLVVDALVVGRRAVDTNVKVVVVASRRMAHEIGGACDELGIGSLMRGLGEQDLLERWGDEHVLESGTFVANHGLEQRPVAWRVEQHVGVAPTCDAAAVLVEANEETCGVGRAVLTEEVEAHVRVAS